MNSTLLTPDGKPVFTQVRSNFSQFLNECTDFWHNAPSVQQAFESDLMTQALISKHDRSLRAQERLQRISVLPGIDEGLMQEPPCSLQLHSGRPRMPTKLVFVFSMIRGWFDGSILSAKSHDALIESQSLAALLDQEEVSLPGATTILENINAISSSTLQATKPVPKKSARDSTASCTRAHVSCLKSCWVACASALNNATGWA